jgi:hypothetical protein
VAIKKKSAPAIYETSVGQIRVWFALCTVHAEFQRICAERVVFALGLIKSLKSDYKKKKK